MGGREGSWAWGVPLHPLSGASIPAVGPLVPAQALLDLAFSFPFSETKSITTNFKSHAEAGLTLAPQRGCQFQAQQERLLCIQGTDAANGQISEIGPLRGVGGTDLAQKGEALFPLYGPGISSEGQGGGWDRDLKVECLLSLVLQLQFLPVLQNPDKS